MKLESSSLGKHTAHFVLQKKTFGRFDMIQKKKTDIDLFARIVKWEHSTSADVIKKGFNKHFFHFISMSCHICV